MVKKATFVGYDCGWGCRDYGCEDGPSALDAAALITCAEQGSFAATWVPALGIRDLGTHKNDAGKNDTLPLLQDALDRLSSAVGKIAKAKEIPVVIGGDHSSAIATWSTLSVAHQAQDAFGLIWIDAHLDSHTQETSWQGKFGGWWHGQPVAALTGHGLPAFTELVAAGRKINPRNVTIIGAHSFEPAEEEYVQSQGIRVIGFDEVAERGFEAAFNEALTRATSDTKAFGVSLDLDVFAPEDAPGVGAAEEKGLHAADVLPILEGLAHHRSLAGIEIVEYNPHRDKDRITANLVEKLVKSLFTNAPRSFIL